MAEQTTTAMEPAALPRVSAVVITYQHEAFIDASIESLVAQDYPNLEIIVVDDGSTDETRARASRYATHGVRVETKRNGGPSSALNRGVDLAGGEIILFQSGDDLSLPGRVRAQVELLSAKPVEIVASLPQPVDGTGRVLRSLVTPRFFAPPDTLSPEDLFREFFYRGNFICAPSVALTRRAWQRVGSFHDGLIQLQDFDYWLRSACLGLTIHVEAEPRVGYRLHGSNLSDISNEPRTHAEYLYILRSIGELVEPAILREVLYGPGSAALKIDLPNRFLLPQLYMRHRAKDVRQIGVDLLLAAMKSEEDRELMARCFGVTPRSVFEMLRKAG
jgi:glycosyltransferase involved in cell wall biosynthesis